MTDISGNFGVNSHSFDKAKPKDANVKPEAAHTKKDTNAPIDLDKSPAALSGKAMVKTNSAKARENAEYKFDPKKVEEDIREFQAFYAVKDVMEDYKQDLIKKGYDETAADDKAQMFAMCLLSNQNV